MGLYKDPVNGTTFEIDDNVARQRGYMPVGAAEIAASDEAAAARARGEDAGITGAAQAAASNFASGLTFGGSDYLLGQTLSPYEREQLLADTEAHPILSTAANIAGAVLPAIAAPGSALARTPAGYLGHAAANAAEESLARGGLAGTAKALAAAGIEGAAQSGGQYIGQTALADKDITAEGLGGALGTGFAFGSVGGGAVLGVSKGLMAGRKLFSRVMQGGEDAAKAAESSWTRASQEILDADTATADVAKQRLDDIAKAKTEAMRQAEHRAFLVREERLRAQSAEPRPVEIAPAEPVPIENAPETAASPTAEAPPVPKPVSPAPAEPPTRGYPGDVGSWLDEEAAAQKRAMAKAEAAPPSLEERMAADRARSRAPGVATKSESLAGQLEQMKARADAGQSLADMRRAHTEELLGKGVAKQEFDLSDAYNEWTAAKADVEGLRDAVAQAPEKPGTARRILDDAHDAALERVQYAATPEEAAKATSEASGLEQLHDRLGGSDEFLPGLSEQVAKLARYEKASAKLTEAVGDMAHPLSQATAKATAAAEDEAVRKMTDRSARAVEDHETFGPAYGPENATSKERIQYAQERQLEADRALKEVGHEFRAAKAEYKGAREKVAVGEKAKKAADRAAAKAAARQATAGAGSKALDLAGFLEVAGGVPGLPKIDDLPVIGPLIGSYLKMRTIRKALGRAGGKVAATADSRVAALAARTQDRVARAVDRSLGGLEKAAVRAQRYVPAAAGVLAARIYDDGSPAPSKTAGVQELAAARIREISAYVNTPNAIENDVRRELRDVSDPDVIEAAEKHRRQTMEFLLNTAPKIPEVGPLQKVVWQPSPAVAMSFGRSLEAVNDPVGVFDRLADVQAQISLEAAKALRVVYPQLFSLAQQRLLEKSAELKQTMPMRQRVQLSLFYGVPLDYSLDPDNLKITQGVYDRKIVPPPMPQPGAPQPSIAQPTNLSQMYQPKSDQLR